MITRTFTGLRPSQAEELIEACADSIKSYDKVAGRVSVYFESDEEAELFCQNFEFSEV